MKDLIILVADVSMRSGIESLLNRKESFGIRQISYDIRVHPERDPGIYKRSADFLRIFLNQYSYALVFLDQEWNEDEIISSDKIICKIKDNLEKSGWIDRSEIIVFEPEFDIWVWAESPHTAKALGWDSYSELSKWLISKGFWEEGTSKPIRPKEALEMVLKNTGIPLSSSIYENIASKVSLRKCEDASFRKFKEILQKWFPA